MSILAWFYIFSYSYGLAHKAGRGIAYLGSKPLGFDPFLVPFKRLLDQDKLINSHFRFITPSKYDDFFSYKVIVPYSFFPDFLIPRRYKLIWKRFWMEFGSTYPLTRCTTCNNGTCTRSPLKVQIKDYESSLLGISRELMMKMIGWTYKNTTYYEYVDSIALLQPENLTRLTFTPMMIHLEAAIIVCDYKRFNWPWETIRFSCETFILKFITPVVAQSDQTKALGKVKARICKKDIVR